jgi:hypothetical protein
MGRDLKYRPGSYYMVDDRTGFAGRAETMKREWDGLMVSERRWEPRQPQDYVRGVRDDQTVPIARPNARPTFYGPLNAALAQAAAPQSSVIYLESAVGMAQGDQLRIMLDTGELWGAIAIEISINAETADITFTNDLGSPLTFTGAGGQAIQFEGSAASGIPVLLSSALPSGASAGNLVFDLGPANSSQGPLLQQGGPQTINTQGDGPINLQE